MPYCHAGNVREDVLQLLHLLFLCTDLQLPATISILRHRTGCREPPEDGLMCELLWSDPKPAAGRGPSQRGVGVGFGPDVTRNFLQDNGLDLLVRSHEVWLLTMCIDADIAVLLIWCNQPDAQNPSGVSSHS